MYKCFSLIEDIWVLTTYISLMCGGDGDGDGCNVEAVEKKYPCKWKKKKWRPY